MRTKLTPLLFTPRDAERITGLSTSMQRDWRHRGFLPSSHGHARFDCFGLASVLTQKLLADRGVGPQLSMDAAHWCGAGIVWHAVAWKDAYEGDHERALEWVPEQNRPPRKTREEFLATLRKAAKTISPGISDAGIEGALSEADTNFEHTHWGWKARYLSQQLLEHGGYRVTPAKFFVWWQNGDHLFTDSIDRAFSGGFSWDERFAGAVIVLDLEAIGNLLLERAARPLVHVEIADDDTS